MPFKIYLKQNKTPWQIGCYLWFVHLLAVFAVASLIPQNKAYSVLLLGCLVSLYYYCKRYLYPDEHIIMLQKMPNREWLLETNLGEECRAKLLANSYVTRYVLILNFTMLETNKKITVIIFKDGLEKDDFRKLLVELLNGG